MIARRVAPPTGPVGTFDSSATTRIVVGVDEQPGRDPDAASGLVKEAPAVVVLDAEAERELGGRAVGERHRPEQLGAAPLAQHARAEQGSTEPREVLGGGEVVRPR